MAQLASLLLQFSRFWSSQRIPDEAPGTLGKLGGLFGDGKGQAIKERERERERETNLHNSGWSQMEHVLETKKTLPPAGQRLIKQTQEGIFGKHIDTVKHQDSG